MDLDDSGLPSAVPIHRLAPLITLAGDLSVLESMLRARLALLRNLPAPAGQETRGTEVRLALVLERQGRYAEAEQLFRDSLDDDRGAPYRRIVAMVRIGRCVGAQGDHEQAGRIFAECARAARRLGPQQAAVRTEIQVSTARDLMIQDRFDDASLILEQAYAALDPAATNAQWSRWSVTTALADLAGATRDPQLEEYWRLRATESFNTYGPVSVCQQ
jgi:tetratricopeptide (TPR) repeat protein